MSTTALLFQFSYAGPWGAELSANAVELAKDIAGETGLISKVWIENQDLEKAGGLYFFTDEEAAGRYRVKHEARLESMGVRDVDVAIYSVNEPLSRLTGVLGSGACPA